MADYLVTDTELTSIANAIRTKGGTSASLSFPTGFVSAINAISGGGATLGTKSITTNGTYNAEDDNLDGYSSVTVNVAGVNISPFTKFNSGTVNYSSNQTSNITITSNIGFVPTFFCLYRRDDTSTQYIVLMSCAYSLASDKQLRQSIMRGSSATAVTSRTAQGAPSSSSSGTLQIQSDGTVKFYAMGNSYILNGYYKWFALA
jgi:hypothetical protein